jgi:hypothetical protein
MGLQYRVVYKKGILNGAADALSHKPTEGAKLFSFSTVQPLWLDRVLASYDNDAHVQSLL